MEGVIFKSGVLFNWIWYTIIVVCVIHVSMKLSLETLSLTMLVKVVDSAGRIYLDFIPCAQIDL